MLCSIVLVPIALVGPVDPLSVVLTASVVLLGVVLQEPVAASCNFVLLSISFHSM